MQAALPQSIGGGLNAPVMAAKPSFSATLTLFAMYCERQEMVARIRDGI